MKLSKLVGATLIAMAINALLAPSVAQACAACFGASDAPMAKGMNMGIFFMLGLVGAVLSTFAVFFVYLGNKARHASTPPAQPVAGV